MLENLPAEQCWLCDPEILTTWKHFNAKDRFSCWSIASSPVGLRLCRFFLQCESVMMVGCEWAVIFLKKLRNYRAMNTKTPQPVYPRTTCHWRTPSHTYNNTTLGCLLELRMCAKLVSWVDPPDLGPSNTLPRPPTFTSDSWLGFLQVFTQGWHVGKSQPKWVLPLIHVVH